MLLKDYGTPLFHRSRSLGCFGPLPVYANPEHWLVSVFLIWGSRRSERNFPAATSASKSAKTAGMTYKGTSKTCRRRYLLLTLTAVRCSGSHPGTCLQLPRSAHQANYNIHTLSCAPTTRTANVQPRTRWQYCSQSCVTGR